MKGVSETDAMLVQGVYIMVSKLERELARDLAARVAARLGKRTKRKRPPPNDGVGKENFPKDHKAKLRALIDALESFAGGRLTIIDFLQAIDGLVDPQEAITIAKGR